MDRDDVVLAFELECPENVPESNIKEYEFKDLLKDSICRERHPKVILLNPVRKNDIPKCTSLNILWHFLTVLVFYV